MTRTRTCPRCGGEVYSNDYTMVHRATDMVGCPKAEPPVTVARFAIDSVNGRVVSAHSDSADGLSEGTMDLDILDPSLMLLFRVGREMVVTIEEPEE